MTVSTPDPGFAHQQSGRFGIVYEVLYGGGSGWGRYVVVDRVLGFRTAWSIHIAPTDPDRMTEQRLKLFRELVTAENERWHCRPPDSRTAVTARRERL